MGTDPDLEQALRTASDPAADPPAREQAFRTLAARRAPEAFPVAAAALGEPGMQSAAVRVLKALGTDPCRDVLLDRLERPGDAPEVAGLAALSDLGWSSPWPVPAARRAAAILSAVLARGPGASSAEALFTAAASLGELSALRSLPEPERAALALSLEKVALDPDPDPVCSHRYAAISCLGVLGTPAAVPLLERCLELPGEQEREHARQVLVGLDLPEARRAVADRGLRLALLWPPLLFLALNAAGGLAAAAALALLFGAPWPWAAGLAVAAAGLPAAAALVQYFGTWRRRAFEEVAFLYGLVTPNVLLVAAAVCLEVWRDWGWTGHALAAGFVLAALVRVAAFLVRARSTP